MEERSPTFQTESPGELLGPEEKSLLLKQAAGSVKWSALGNLLPRLVSPVSTMILAAILTPADFGTVAVSTLVIALAQILVGLGLGPAVVQRRTAVDEAASVALWLSLSAAGVLYGLLWFAAPWLAQVYHIPLVAPVVRVSGLSLFLFAMGSIPTALLQRDLRFRKLFWVESLSQLTGVATSLTLALLGAGVWALVVGPLAGAAVRTALAWFFARWRPLLAMSRAGVRPLLGFSAWMMGASFQSWLFLYADNAIAGYFLGETGLGIYSLGFSLSNLLPGLVIPALSAVAYPAFCTLQSDRLEVGRSLLQLQSMAAAVLFPVCFGLSAIAVPAVALLYGDKWQGLGEVIRLLAIMPGISHLWSLNADAYRAVGRPDVWTKLAGVTLLILMPLLLWAGRYGLMPFTYARFGGHFFYPLLNILFGGRVLGLSIKDQGRALATPLGCVLVMYALALLLVRGFTPFAGVMGWLKLLVVMAIAAATYILLLRIVNRDLWGRLLLASRQVLWRV
jgi:teichuronic acid exporter